MNPTHSQGSTAVSLPAADLESVTERLVGLPEVVNPRLSFQRDRTAFYWNRTGRMELYVMALADARPVQLSHGETAVTPYFGNHVWDRVGQSIVFSKDTAGDEKSALFRLGFNGKVEPIGDAPPGQNLPLEFSPSDGQLLVASDRADPAGVQRLELWSIDLATNRWNPVARHRQAPYLWWTSNFWSPSGGQLAYSASDSEDAHDAAIMIAPSPHGARHEVFHAKDGSRDFPGAWHPDGHRLSITSEATGQQRAGVLDVDTGKVQWLTSGSRDEIAGEFSPDGRRMAAIRFQGVDVVPVAYDLLSEKAEVPSESNGVVLQPEFDLTGRSLVFGRNHPMQRNCIVRWNLADGSVHPLLLPDLDPASPTVGVEPEVVEYRTSDGLTIEGLLYRPPTLRAALRAPTLVHVHGGPTGQFWRDWSEISQMLSAVGFVVLEPNIRGSTGYGVRFRDLNRMDLGGGDLRDVVEAAGYLRSLPFVDPDRLGIFGISYGGYMTYLALVKAPQVWSAGCAINGVTDWKSEYETETPALQQYDRELMGDPIENAALWADRSPVTFAEQLRAKFLMLHSVNDPRCPLGQARLFRDRLRALGREEGRDFEYHEFADEGHWSADPIQRAKTLRLLRDFFVRTLLAASESPG